MRKYIDIVESFEGAFNTRRAYSSQTKTCEVFRNPTRKEFSECGGEIRAFLVGDDVLMWNAFGALHGEVREHMKLDADAISLEIYSEGYGSECIAMVTDITRRTKWYHNPEIVDEIKSNSGLNRMFDHVSIEYFDEAIYGAWDDLADHGDIHDDDEDELQEASGNHTPPEYEDGDEAHYDALDRTGFFGEQAAGCIAMARTTGRILVVLRSQAVEQPFTWGNVGGAHHSDETPVHAAERELYEETGYHGRCEMIPLLVFTKGTFRYCNFLALVDDEFVPVLGWEADDYKWVEFGNWPQPLHFGLQALFNDAASVDVIKSYKGVEK